jgi:hypothetical protein
MPTIGSESRCNTRSSSLTGSWRAIAITGSTRQACRPYSARLGADGRGLARWIGDVREAGAVRTRWVCTWRDTAMRPRGTGPLGTRHLYAAAFTNPGAIAHPAFPKRELLPGTYSDMGGALAPSSECFGLRPLEVESRTDGLQSPQKIGCRGPRLAAISQIRPASLLWCAHQESTRDAARLTRTGNGVACQWDWTSDVHRRNSVSIVRHASNAARRFRTGQSEFADVAASSDAVVWQVTFIIGHRGLERAPSCLRHWLLYAAQRDVNCGMHRSAKQSHQLRLH